MLPQPLALLTRYLAAAAVLALSLSGVLSAHAVRAPKERTGKELFGQLCAKCHGAKGEGTRIHRKALAGTRSVTQLSQFIAKSMPPGAPKKLPGKEAARVAAYIFDAFYSPLAQARVRPARVDLARLTVRQYRNALADLVGSFRPRPDGAPGSEEPRGLRGEYFKTARMRGGERILERVDPQIRFDFGTTGALPEQDDPYTFAMRWEGSVLAPETGEYYFIVRTEHAMRLWVNDLRRPLIDALVKSGSDNEYRAPLYLLGGRAYSLRLEFSKGVQGVDDLKKLKEKPPTKAVLVLEWKPPKQAAETIPSHLLWPRPAAETYAAATPFPPDDRSMGYERGTTVSKAWDEATTEGALETAGYVVAHLPELAGVADDSGGSPEGGRRRRPETTEPKPAEDAAGREQRIRAFCRQFVERAFRRPLTSDQELFFVTRQFEGAPDLETAVKRVVLLALKSPRFLYRELGATTPDAYDVASRLSFGLWDSLPDEELLKAAAAGELATREQVAPQAERLAADPRAWAKLRGFFMQWLKVDQYPDLAKDPKRFPGFDEGVAEDLRASLELTLEQVVRSERSDFRELLLSDQLFLNGRLASIYGVELPADAPFQRVSLEPAERAGVLTHPYLLAAFAYLDTSSPIHRGVLVARNLLGRPLMPPPQAFTPLPAALHPDLTTRQRVAMQTKPAACVGCHGMINPLGFTLERFDAIGRLRAEENGKPVDASGRYESRSGKVVKFAGVRDLAQFLAGSEEAHAAFVEQLFEYTVKQPAQAFGPHTLTDLRQAFEKNQFNIRQQLVEVMTVSALNSGQPPRPPRPVTGSGSGKPVASHPGLPRSRGGAKPPPTGR
jgi:mono/diheme cytochrome c family protein